MKAFIVKRQETSLLIATDGAVELHEGAHDEIRPWAEERGIEVVDAQVEGQRQNLRSFVTISIVLALIGISLALMFHDIPETGRDPLIQLIGNLNGSLVTIVAFFFLDKKAGP